MSEGAGVRFQHPSSGVDPEPRDSDAALMHRVVLGDHDAFSVLYGRVAPAVMGIVVRVVRDVAQSEEVVQEVMLQVWRQAANFEPERGRVRTWILTMAHSRAIERVRSAEASRGRDQRYHGLADVEVDVVIEEVESLLDRERVRHALAVLTPLQREVIELAYYRGYTHVQVAQVLDIPLGTAKTRIRDALIRLRDTLGATA